jgi:hypothetical protein
MASHLKSLQFHTMNAKANLIQRAKFTFSLMKKLESTLQPL